jgi:hypothetical protein
LAVEEGSTADAIATFIARWRGVEGGQERANYQLFLIELCKVLDLANPDPSSPNTEQNDYVFERLVKRSNSDGTASLRRIDLYKRGSFVLEAKQSRQRGGKKEIAGQNEKPERSGRGVKTANRAWDVLMLHARSQAEEYARILPVSHGWPPFIIVCDVGHVFEIYADFSGLGKNYAQFPDRQSFRIHLEDLRDPNIRARIVAIWKDPLSLDPARASAQVTRQVAERLAAVSKTLVARYSPDHVAMFLMRCIFTMFAQDAGLLPRGSFTELLKACEAEPTRFDGKVGNLWEAMNKGDYAYSIFEHVRRFNGKFFEACRALPLNRDEIRGLLIASTSDWREVDPSIFGTLLEQALSPVERRQLGAHYTPRTFVERLIVATIMERLRKEWAALLSTAELQKAEGRSEDAIASISTFHDKLCSLRILDPACGTGNFLYVSLEMMKRLEGDVLEALVNLGGQEALHGLEGHTVDPRQFLGLEVSASAAAIAELVLWIGHLRWHIRTKGGLPSEPILQAFGNIKLSDAVLLRDVPLANATNDELPANATQPTWPEADFIIGNPPFIGGKFLRERLGATYVEALWEAHPKVNASADFVMYWWDHAAELLVAENTRLKRFGFVTTNSITQKFQGRIVERHLKSKPPVSIVMAIPDHPWTKVTKDAAAVRIAMTVVEAGASSGSLCSVVREAALNTDAPIVELEEKVGTIHSDLKLGAGLTDVSPLLANKGICSPGVKLHGSGFVVTAEEAQRMGLLKRDGLQNHIRAYRHGRDVMNRARDAMVVDLFGLSSEFVRTSYPEVYQHLLEKVKPERLSNSRASYRYQWWIFGEPRSELRAALQDLKRFVVTPVTSKHRVFVTMEPHVLPDDALMCFAFEDAYELGVLQSRTHLTWVSANASSLGAFIGDVRYIKSRCFDPFPFPAVNSVHKQPIRFAAEQLETHRQRVLAEHKNLTLTELYNVLDQVRANHSREQLGGKDRRILEDGQVLILNELHNELDRAVNNAYGWSNAISDEEILCRLVSLNKERAAEEARGQIRWLRPEYQIPRFSSTREKCTLDLVGGEMHTRTPVLVSKLSFPTDEIAQTAAVITVLANARSALDASGVAAAFRQGGRSRTKIASVLAALTRTGHIESMDGGRRFRFRRAA